MSQFEDAGMDTWTSGSKGKSSALSALLLLPHLPKDAMGATLASGHTAEVQEREGDSWEEVPESLL
jgi:hypothetical protein